MVDALQLLADISSAIGYLVVPPLVWLFLYFLAWERGPLARQLGFGRRTFWLLVPMGIVGEYANLPFFAWQGDILAINLAGGLLPVVLASMLLLRVFPARAGVFGRFLLVFATESAALFVLVVIVPATGVPQALLLLPVAVAFPLVVILLGSSPDMDATEAASRRQTGWFLAAASAMLYGTFLTTSTVPGAGIESVFPVYLLLPILLGVLLAALVPAALGLPRPAAIPLSYSAATFGVLIGADLLRQPPLYTGGPPALYSIGGAGLQDLLYLTGLLAGLASYLTTWLLDTPALRSPDPVPPPTPRPSALLDTALRLGVAGRPGESVRTAQRATHLAAGRARSLLEIPEGAPGQGAWDGIPVPPWIVGDQRNLDALAEQPSVTPTDAYRGWLTARWLVRLGREIAGLRFAPFLERAWAFSLDLVILTAPAVALWGVIALLVPGSASGALGSLALNAAAYGYAGFGFLYFAVFEGVEGRTLGKRWRQLRVTTIAKDRPGWRPVLLRNIPKLIPLTVIGEFGAALVVLLVHSSGPLNVGSGPAASLSSAFGVLLVSAVLVLGVAVSAAASAIAITFSGERQRLGDYLAGTWVLRVPPTAPAGRTVAGPVPAGAPGPFG